MVNSFESYQQRNDWGEGGLDDPAKSRLPTELYNSSGNSSGNIL